MAYKLLQGHTVTIITAYVLLAVFLLSFDPYSLPVLLLLVPFLLFFIGSFFLLYRGLLYFNKKLRAKISSPRCARTAFILSGAPTFLVLLQSIGQVGVFDIVTTTVLFIASDFYLARSKFGIFKVHA